MTRCRSCTSLAERKKRKATFRKTSDNAVLSLPSIIRKGIFQRRDFPVHVG